MSQGQTRKVAVRAFASEVEDAQHQYKESDEDRAPNLALLPTGVEANRVFVVGTLTDREDVGNDSEYFYARVTDPTGVYHVYAGQYQPDAAQLIRETETPEYVALTGKVSRYELDNGDFNVTLRPETMTVTDQATRDKWVVETAERTLDRIDAFRTESDDADVETPIQKAKAQYDPRMDYIEQDVKDALLSA
jgi:RPA family protein